MESPDPQILESRAAALIPNGSNKAHFARAFQTLKHYRWDQIATRAINLFSQKIRGTQHIGNLNSPSDYSFDPNLFIDFAQAQLADHLEHIHHGRSDLQAGNIVLLNKEVAVGWPIQWHNPGIQQLPHLWRFQFQYHEYLLAHIADAPQEELELRWLQVWQALSGWVDAFPPEGTARKNDAWHPFCISRRIPVWINLLTLSEKPPDQLKKFLKSLFQQASWLSKNLETDLGGNHLLENLTALAMASCFFRSRETHHWHLQVKRLLPRELKRQILSTGEHFERSPMYHCQVIRNLLVVAKTSADTMPDISTLCHQKAKLALEFLLEILHPDGEIPLFSDSGFGEAPSVTQIRTLAGASKQQQASETSEAFVRGNYWISRPANEKNSFLVFDAGKVAADDLPSHSHCDLLGFEASIGGKRWFVDSGNFNYEDDPVRQYCRSSLAHNVVTVAHENSCQIWSRFRMGNRGRITTFEHGRENTTSWATAGHDGYRHLGVSEINRLVAIDGHSFWLVADCAKSQKKVDLFGYLHLAPELTLSVQENSNEFQLSDGLTRRQIKFFGVKNVVVSGGWFCKGFGFKEAHQVFVYQADASNSPFGWSLSKTEANVSIANTKRTLSLFSTDRKHPQFAWEFP